MRKVLSEKNLAAMLGLAVWIVAACSSGGGGATELPTATTIPFYSFVSPTAVPVIATVAAATATAEKIATPALDPNAVSNGKAQYERLQCGSCHGANGEGTDKGKTLIGLTMSLDDFISFLRSGGTVGISHQFATNRLSDNGGKNLYQYIVSLSGNR